MNHFHSLKVIFSLNNFWFNFTVSNSNFLFFKLINLMLHPSFNMCKFRLLWYICWLHRPYFTFLTQFLVRQKIISPCLFFIMYICVIFVVFSFFITLLIDCHGSVVHFSDIYISQESSMFWCMAVIYSISLVHSELMTDTGCMVVINSISFVYSELMTYRSPYKDDVIQYSQYIKWKCL